MHDHFDLFVPSPAIVVQLVLRFLALLALESTEVQAELANALALGARALALLDATAANCLVDDLLNLASGAHHRARAPASPTAAAALTADTPFFAAIAMPAVMPPPYSPCLRAVGSLSRACWRL